MAEAPLGDETIRTEGYAAVGSGPEGQDDYYWVCETCFDDFRERFSWTIVAAPEQT